MYQSVSGRIWAGEIGKLITMYVDNPDINISGWTCNLYISTVNSTEAPTPVSATPSSDGTYATYSTTGSEFPSGGGQYKFELHVQNSPTSPTQLFKYRVIVKVDNAF